MHAIKAAKPPQTRLQDSRRRASKVAIFPGTSNLPEIISVRTRYADSSLVTYSTAVAAPLYVGCYAAQMALFRLVSPSLFISLATNSSHLACITCSRFVTAGTSSMLLLNRPQHNAGGHYQASGWATEFPQIPGVEADPWQSFRCTIAGDCRDKLPTSTRHSMYTAYRRLADYPQWRAALKLYLGFSPHSQRQPCNRNQEPGDSDPPHKLTYWPSRRYSIDTLSCAAQSSSFSPLPMFCFRVQLTLHEIVCQ
ncbi:hypothetical protein HRG_014842 [Hirsutella rhossiliensis]